VRADGAAVGVSGLAGGFFKAIDKALGSGRFCNGPEHELQTLPYWQSVKNLHFTYRFSQILMIEPKIFMLNPHAASIYGCIR
jgi:hypothetical protein